MFKILSILALQDNYIWLICNPNTNAAVVVDPGEQGPVISYFTKNNLTLTAILITHHHMDHTAGVPGLLAKWDVPVYGSTQNSNKYITNRLGEDDIVRLSAVDMQLSVIEVPGHTLDHIAYYGHGVLFCGDTLFAGGCGRIFEGTAKQMLASLQKLQALPQDTCVYSAHEYTLQNLYFAKQVEPNNAMLQQRILTVKTWIEKKLPTLPSSLVIERQTNPFLRIKEDEVIKALENHYGKQFASETELFAHLRQWKDYYKNK